MTNVTAVRLELLKTIISYIEHQPDAKTNWSIFHNKMVIYLETAKGIALICHITKSIKEWVTNNKKFESFFISYMGEIEDKFKETGIYPLVNSAAFQRMYHPTRESKSKKILSLQEELLKSQEYNFMGENNTIGETNLMTLILNIYSIWIKNLKQDLKKDVPKCEHLFNTLKQSNNIEDLIFEEIFKDQLLEKIKELYSKCESLETINSNYVNLTLFELSNITQDEMNKKINI